MIEPIQKYFPALPGQTPRKVYAKMIVATGEILTASAPYANSEDDSEIIGSDGTVKYLPVMEEPDPPSTGHNADLFYVEPTKEVTADAFIIRKVYKPRSKEERKARLRNISALKDEQLSPSSQRLRPIYNALTMIFAKMEGVEWNSKQKATRAQIIATTKLLNDNEEAVATKEALIDAGQDPDLNEFLVPTNG